MEYKDFTKHPKKLLTEGKTNEVVKVSGIARACEIVILQNKARYILGFLELDKDKFIRLFGKVEQPGRTLRYLNASSESNQDIQIKGVYFESGPGIAVEYLKLGNLEGMIVPTDLKESIENYF